MYDNQILKNYMRDRNYAKCISILKEKITSFILSKIQIYDNSIDFTTVSDLISESEFFLKDSTVARRLDDALSQETEMEQIQNLLAICEQYNIR